MKIFATFAGLGLLASLAAGQTSGDYVDAGSAPPDYGLSYPASPTTADYFIEDPNAVIIAPDSGDYTIGDNTIVSEPVVYPDYTDTVVAPGCSSSGFAPGGFTVGSAGQPIDYLYGETNTTQQLDNSDISVPQNSSDSVNLFDPENNALESNNTNQLVNNEYASQITGFGNNNPALLDNNVVDETLNSAAEDREIIKSAFVPYANMEKNKYAGGEPENNANVINSPYHFDYNVLNKPANSSDTLVHLINNVVNEPQSNSVLAQPSIEKAFTDYAPQKTAAVVKSQNQNGYVDHKPQNNVGVVPNQVEKNINSLLSNAGASVSPTKVENSVVGLGQVVDESVKPSNIDSNLVSASGGFNPVAISAPVLVSQPVVVAQPLVQPSLVGVANVKAPVYAAKPSAGPLKKPASAAKNPIKPAVAAKPSNSAKPAANAKPTNAGKPATNAQSSAKPANAPQTLKPQKPLSASKPVTTDKFTAPIKPTTANKPVTAARPAASSGAPKKPSTSTSGKKPSQAGTPVKPNKPNQASSGKPAAPQNPKPAVNSQGGQKPSTQPLKGGAPNGSKKPQQPSKSGVKPAAVKNLKSHINGKAKVV